MTKAERNWMVSLGLLGASKKSKAKKRRPKIVIQIASGLKSTETNDSYLRMALEIPNSLEAVFDLLDKIRLSMPLDGEAAMAYLEQADGCLLAVQAGLTPDRSRLGVDDTEALDKFHQEKCG